MKLYASVGALWALIASVSAHEDDRNAGYQEPFVGWTKEDLDAKWGVDVSPRSL